MGTKEKSELGKLREKDVLKLTPLEWCIIALDKTGQSFEAAYDAAEELARLKKLDKE